MLQYSIIIRNSGNSEINGQLIIANKRRNESALINLNNFVSRRYFSKVLLRRGQVPYFSKAELQYVRISLDGWTKS